MNRHHSIAVASAMLGLVLWMAGPAGAPASAGAPSVRFDHSTWDGLVKTYVDDDGLVDYRRWKANDARRLKAYLAIFSFVNPEQLADRSERLAFWINAYNALTVDAILHFYPLKSIKDKVSRVVGYNVWDDYRMSVGGTEYSLNDIEHKVLRPMQEPRIHFAIVCASKSCPVLRNEAYTSTHLDAQLDDATRGFFASPRGLRLDPEAGRASLSSILKWFAEDFGTDEERRDFVARYAPTPAARNLLRSPDVKIGYLTYDWGLNEQP
jgi:hypothetical protein